MAKEILNDSPPLSAQEVADAFVRQYYLILHSSPQLTHKFYNDNSIMARPGSGSTMIEVSGMKEIDDVIMSMDYKECLSKISIVHAQSSLNEAVIVGVTGQFTGKDSIERKFSQTFLLAPQATGGYYVMNDFLFYIDLKETVTPPTISVDVLENAPTSPLAQDPEPAHVLDIKNASLFPKLSDQSDEKSVVAKSSSTAKPSSSKNNVVSVPKPVETFQIDESKKSYASTLRFTVAASPAPVVVRVNPSQQSSSDAPLVPKPASPTKTSVTTSNDADGSINSFADVKSIHINGLPFEITNEDLIERFKKFGVVKERSVRIKRFEDGHCYAFLEFEAAKSAHAAVESRKSFFGPWEAHIHYKKSSDQSSQGGNNRGRSPLGRGGYKNDNLKGRENFGEGQRAGRYKFTRGGGGSPTGHGENYRDRARGSSRGRYENYQDQARGSSRGRSESFWDQAYWSSRGRYTGLNQRQGYQNGGFR